VQGSADGRESLSWDDVRLLLALGRSRTLGEAAGRLGVDGSTVSRRLTALEQALAATLFERGRSGISATEAALELMPVAEEIEYAMARFTGTAESFEREVAGTVRLAFPPDAAEVLLLPLLPKLLDRHPELRVHIDPGEAVVDMARRGADLALRVVRPDQGDLVFKRLDTIRWVAAAAPDRVQAWGPIRRWDQVPWIGWGERFRHVPAARWLADHGSGVEPVLASNSVRLQVIAAAQGLGAVVMPEPSVEHYGLARLRLGRTLRASASEWPSEDLYLVTHRALRSVPRVRAVWDFLVEHIGRTSGGASDF
jgi:DNA-binding transcriptional LysR family regulator